MERYYTTNMGYSSAALPTTACRTELSAHYSFAFSAGPAAATYTLAATPQGSQASQDSCGTLTINQAGTKTPTTDRSEEHTSELQSLMRISYAVFCLKKKKNTNNNTTEQ